MKRSTEACIVLIILVFGCQAALGNRSAATVQGIIGKYVLTKDDAFTSMEVKAEEDRYVILLSGGGGSEEAGAAAAADCMVRAVGKLEGSTLIAAFTAIETDTFSYSSSEAESEDRKVTVVFRHKEAEVVQADTFGYCGLGAQLSGSYRRETDK